MKFRIVSAILLAAVLGAIFLVTQPQSDVAVPGMPEPSASPEASPTPATPVGNNDARSFKIES